MSSKPMDIIAVGTAASASSLSQDCTEPRWDQQPLPPSIYQSSAWEWHLLPIFPFLNPRDGGKQVSENQAPAPQLWSARQGSEPYHPPSYTSPESCVLVPAGCYTTCRRGGLFSIANVFLPDLKAGCSRSRCSMVGWGLSSEKQTSYCIFTRAARGDGVLWVFVHKALILIMRAPPSWLKHLPQAPTTNTITFES